MAHVQMEQVPLAPSHLQVYMNIPVCLISSLQSLFSIPDFYNQCEQWRFSFESNSILTDVYCGQVWNDFLNFEDKSFLEEPNSIAFMLNLTNMQEYTLPITYLYVHTTLYKKFAVCMMACVCDF